MIATMDTLVEGTHFLPSDPIGTVGQKLIRVNVSDILAKGARPHEALLSVSWSSQRSEQDFAALMAGIATDLKQYGIDLLGGDFVTVDGPVCLSLTLTGVCYGEGPVRRRGARIGDEVWVSGQIGWGHIGLEAARAKPGDDLADRYRVPALPNPDVAKTVSDAATASLDVSDGLLIDAYRLAEASDCGIMLDLADVPLARPSSDLEQIMAQCTGGDDYQVLMTAPAGQVLEEFTKIGIVIEDPGLSLNFRGQSVNLPETLGFEH